MSAFSPEELSLTIKEKYAEYLIYKEYVKEYKDWYIEESLNHRKMFNNLQKTLSKDTQEGEISFIINMGRYDEYRKHLLGNNILSKPSIQKMSGNNTIQLCKENNLQTVKDVLYLIRCNIFHGQKTPGDERDDEIVQNALPLLSFLVKKLMCDHEIDYNKSRINNINTQNEYIF